MNEPSGGYIYGILSKDIYQKSYISGKRQKKTNKKIHGVSLTH